MPSRTARRKVLAVVGVALVAATSCIPKFGTKAGPLMHEVLTADGSDVYRFTTVGATTTFQAPSTNQGGNHREFYWNTSAPFTEDQESCDRWDSIMDMVAPGSSDALTRANMWQPGVGLRIAPTPDGNGLRGISVNLDIWGEAWWILQVNGWDTTNTAQVHVGLANFDLSSIVGPADGLYAPPPWNECAQVYGNTLRVKVWIGNRPEPSWSDATHVFTATLPPEWDFAGYPGGYVAHVAPGVSKQITMLRTGALEPDGSYPPPPSSSTSSSAPASTTTTVTPSSTTSAPPASTTTTVAP